MCYYEDVYLRDRALGTTVPVSVGPSGLTGNGNSWHGTITDDGDVVAFVSEASDLVAGDSNGVADVFVRFLDTGGTVRVSVSTAGAEADGFSADPVISADGSAVAFTSFATNLVAGDTNASEDVFVHDLNTGTTTRVNVTSAGGQSVPGSVAFPSLSWDGRYVGFDSTADNLVPGDTNGYGDCFVYDRQVGLQRRRESLGIRTAARHGWVGQQDLPRRLHTSSSPRFPRTWFPVTPTAPSTCSGGTCPSAWSSA